LSENTLQKYGKRELGERIRWVIFTSDTYPSHPSGRAGRPFSRGYAVAFQLA